MLMDRNPNRLAMISITRYEDGQVSFGKLDFLIKATIILSVITFSIETLPHLSENTHRLLKIFEIFCVILFSIEYVSRIYFSRKRSRYIFSFFGIIDFLAILPFYLSLGIDLRGIRALRILRLFRILKLARYSAAIQRFHRAFILAKEEIILFFSTALILIFLSAVGIYYFEHEVQPKEFGSVFECLWWAIITLTTVGYGDVYPITIGGRIFTFFVLVVGLGIVTVPSGLVAASLSRAREQEPNQ